MTQAIVLSKEGDAFRAEIRAITDAELEAATPGDDVVIGVEYSTINYKDGLALTNTSPVVRKWPMVAGIDAAGKVIHSTHTRWKAGDAVVINGWGLGETHWGGLAQRARVKGDWLVRIPAPFTARDAMAIGTAGYTAALSVLALQAHGVTPTQGEILVTGATGGVGSVAVALLSSLGYTVVGSTGKSAESRLPEVPGSPRSHRPRLACRRGQAAAEGPLGRRDRFGRKRDAGQRLRADALRAARSLPAVLPAAWTFPPQWRHLSCAA